MLVGGNANVSPLGLAFVLIMAVSVLLVRREWAFIPIILVSCFVTIGQRMVIGGIDVTLLRLIILVCWVRVWLRQEWRGIEIQAIDVIIGLWVIAKIVTGLLLWRTTGALINRLGQAYDILGIYLLFRCLVRSTFDLRLLARTVSWVVIPLGLFMLLEVMTGRNAFAIFGGVPEFTVVRNGRLRAQGTFRHPILAGTFGAWAFAVIASRFHNSEKAGLITYLGVGASILIVGASSSSGPVLALAAGIAAICAWVIRAYMKSVRRLALLGIIVIDLIMTAPIWYLIARISYVMGGTGWHRSRLIDQSIAHIHEWWKFGTNYTAHWMPYALESNPDMVDITNQYLAEGITGGLVTMVLFLLIILRAYAVVRRETQKNPLLDEADQWLVWTVGAGLTIHVVSFMSVTYFDQIIVFWYLTLASVAAIDNQARRNYDELIEEYSSEPYEEQAVGQEKRWA